VLLELVDFPEPGVRANAAHALGRLGGEDVGGALLALLADEDSLVRLQAAESLGVLGYVGSVDALADTLRRDADALVRLHAAEALGA
jgi:HEAT repeat protein